MSSSSQRVSFDQAATNDTPSSFSSSLSKREMTRRLLFKMFFSTSEKAATGEGEDGGDVYNITDKQVDEGIELLKSIGMSEEIATANNMRFALENDYSQGNIYKAIELIQFFKDAADGILIPILSTDSKQHSSKSLIPRRRKSSNNNSISGDESYYYYKLLGSDNFKGISCYIDSLLVAMFARLESFEPILFKNAEHDQPKEYLSTFLRFYINLLRSGKPITTDITKGLLDSIFDAGWNPSFSNKNQQQDCGELFSFITEILDMPLLTLKMDIAHGGKEVVEDDHKLINESLLHVPVPGNTDDSPILLEECLELYFSNSVSVSRQIERRRTLDSVSGSESISVLPSSLSTRKLSSSNIQEVETTSNQEEDEPHNNYEEEPPSYDSLFQNDKKPPPSSSKVNNPLWTPNMEITLPAWMFLQLLPFYADTKPNREGGDIPSAQYFSNSRPVLGICLKRYYWTSGGYPKRNGRKVIVPQVIHLPPFVADDNMENDYNVFGNFKLVLESAIFHRGTSLNSGHFVTLIGEDNKLASHESPPPTSVIPPTMATTTTANSPNKRLLPWRKNSSTNIETEQAPASSIWRSLSSRTPKTPASEQPPQSNPTIHIGEEFSGDYDKRWLLFDDLKEMGQKFTSVNYEEVFQQECPYLLFYRMVQIDDGVNGNDDVDKNKTSNSSEVVSIITTTDEGNNNVSTSEENDEEEYYSGRNSQDQRLGAIHQATQTDEPRRRSYQTLLGLLSRSTSPDDKQQQSESPNTSSKKHRHLMNRSHREKYREEKCSIM